MTDGSAERRRRAEYRAYVREHHPDVGGDADAFVAGVADLHQRWAAEQPTGQPDPYDAPIEIVRTRTTVRRLVRWWRRTTGPPRVR